ncbi:MAG: GH92 family glycosyl hydrolase, partial [Kiritimatiellae bacterium]|nr:GH92 family glycosyl hydrolase [Kiritimatiellia bacterium]
MASKILFAFASAAAASCVFAQPDIFIGSQGLGHVSPAAAWPFGAVQAGPDTSDSKEEYVGDWPHTCGYQHSDRYLWRFSQNRFYGIGCGSMGLAAILPSKDPFAGADALCAEMDKPTEVAEPGYYAVTLKDGNIRCEMSALAHTAAYRFTYPENAGGKAYLLVDADWGVQQLNGLYAFESPDGCFGRRVLDGVVKLQTPETALLHCRQTAWSEIDCWAAMEFSRPVVSARRLRTEDAWRGQVWEYCFELPESGVLEVRVALSSVSIRGAQRNLALEMPDFAFESVRGKSAAEWAKYLGRIEIEADPKTKRIFEAAYYRTLIHPSDIGDIGAPMYSNLSLWDIFRSCAPLQTITAPEKTGEYCKSFIDIFEKQGYLPILHNWGSDTHCMIGHHAVPILVDNYLKGIGGFDAEKAYEAIKDSLTRNHLKSGDGTWGLLKEDWDLLDRYGYYPFDLLPEQIRGRKVVGESVSRLLECAYDDACAARMAAALGKTEDAEFFAKRSGFWRNVFDPSTGFARGRDSSGAWREPFDPKSCGAGPWAENDFTEGNSWQYTFHVMHDPKGFAEALGGKAALGEKLDALFGESSEVYGPSFLHDVSGLIGQYAHGNEPSHHIAYFYRFSDRPGRTEQIVREICTGLYNDTPDGDCGNDDAGAMASWYVFS